MPLDDYTAEIVAEAISRNEVMQEIARVTSLETVAPSPASLAGRGSMSRSGPAPIPAWPRRSAPRTPSASARCSAATYSSRQSCFSVCGFW
jgi:hypothetical protein